MLFHLCCLINAFSSTLHGTHLFVNTHACTWVCMSGRENGRKKKGKDKYKRVKVREREKERKSGSDKERKRGT